MRMKLLRMEEVSDESSPTLSSATSSDTSNSSYSSSSDSPKDYSSASSDSNEEPPTEFKIEDMKETGNKESL